MTTQATLDISKSAQDLVASIDAEIARLQAQRDSIVVAFGMQRIAGEALDKPTLTRTGPGVVTVEWPEDDAKPVAKKAAKKSLTKSNEALLTFLAEHVDGAKAEDLGKVVGKKGRNLTRHLVRLIDAKVLGRKGKGRGTLYFAR